MNIRDIEIKINEPKNICKMCKKGHNPLKTHVFSMRGRIYCVCKDCLTKIEKFIETNGNH